MYKFFAVCLVLLWFVLPEPTIAQVAPGGFVPCNGSDCSACNLVDMVNKIIVWLFGIVFLIFAYLMVVAGFGLVTSKGNQSALEAAKSKFTNAIIGIIIVMAAWLLVDTVMRQLLDGNGSGNLGQAGFTGWGPWSEVQCSAQTQTTAWPGDPNSPGTPPPAPLPGTPPTPCSGGTCVALGIPCSNAGSCSISPSLVTQFQNFHTAAGVVGARVTEAMPPTRTHRSACHNNGTCVDYSKAGGMTAAEVSAVITAARANNLRPVYEVQTQSQKDALVAGGAPADAIIVLGNWISAPHFSIYGY